MGSKTRRRRPLSLPEEAHWDKEDQYWAVGSRDASGNKCGNWQFYWPKTGEPSGTVGYDGDGLRHGYGQWVHPNGELWQSGSYDHGTMHGRFSWQHCVEPSPGDAMHPWSIGGAVRIDKPFVDGEQQEYHLTLYNQSGADAPLACDSQGRTLELGKNLDKLLLDTTLLMTEESAVSVDGVRVARPALVWHRRNPGRPEPRRGSHRARLAARA